MEQYVIKGGVHLEGEVVIAGAKNAALGILAAAIMTEDECTIENVPYVSDTITLLKAIENIGASVKYIDKHTVVICGKGIRGDENLSVDDEYIRKIRASYYLLGALLGRFNYADVALPGGCDIGARPIDLHMKGFNKLGATTDIVSGGKIIAKADKLTGAHIYLDTVSVGATINIMLAAALAEGKTTIENAAKEPHIVDVANFLNTMGANIKGAGTDTIRIQGVPVLPGGYSYSVIPDQIEAGTYMIAAAVTRGDVTIHNLIPKHMEPLTVKMLEMGFNIDQGDDWIRVSIDDDTELEPTNFKTRPYPGFPTDLQPQATVLLCHAHGMSQMHENVWDNRFQYVPELQSMGASISVMERIALVHGPVQFSGARVSALDLRAGAAMVLAGLSAEGTTTIAFANRIERGYEKIVEKLRGIGAEIEHIEEEEEHILPVDDE